MSKISESESIKGKDIKIGGIMLTIFPANIDDLEFMMDLGDGDKLPCPHCGEEIVLPKKDITPQEQEEYMKKRAKATRELIYNTMKAADPEAEEDELKRFCMKNLKEIMEAIVEVNELKNVA